MAFYNRRMAQNKELSKAWRAGHRMEIHRDEQISLPTICDEIGHRMRRARHPRKRLSLRTFTVLLSGAIRLYRDQANLLLKDTSKCSVYPVSKFPTDDDTNSADENDTSESESTEYNTDTESLPSDAAYETIAEETVEESTSTVAPVSTVSTVSTVIPNSTRHPEERDPTEKRDQIIQTSPTPPEHFDPNLPFGYIIVHDNFYSRVPSTVLLSSLPGNFKFVPARRPMN